MKTPTIHTYFFSLIALLLIACTQSSSMTTHSASQESDLGYPNSPLVQAESALPITNRNANIRTGPSVTTEWMLTAPRGTVLNVVGVNPNRDWYLLDSGGWVATFLVDNAPTELPVVVPESTTDISVSPTSLPPATGGLPVEQAIQEVLDEVAQAMQAQDSEALERLIDPNADSNWVYRYTQSVHPPTNTARSDVQSANAGEISIELQRVMMTNQWAMAAIIISGQDPEEDTVHQTYTYQTLYNREGVGWQLTSPVPQAWGQQQELILDCLELTYYAFDEPYVQAAAPRIEEAYRLLEEDFAIPFCEENGPMTLGIVPRSLWESVSGEKILSPLAFDFPLSLAATPADFLVGFVTDILGHMLLESAYDSYGKEMSRTQLSHIAIQWEVDTATGYNLLQDGLAQVSQAEEPIPLKLLLDPTEMIHPENGERPRDLLSYFIKETYGRSSFGPFIQAVFETESADELTQAAFDLPLEVVEEAWQAWLFLSTPVTSEDDSGWQTYREADDLFTVEHPPGWTVHEAGSAQSDRIWEFTHPENRQSVITVVKHLTRIPADMSLIKWVEQAENYEFEFERIHSETITIEDADAYLIHDRLIGIERDVYITYLRCGGTVWSLHLRGSSEGSEALGTLYEEMLMTFRPTCIF